MKLDVIIDTICPWCYIGQRRLERALASRPDLDVTLAWHPFQLNPRMPPEGRPRGPYLAAKFGNVQRAQRQDHALAKAGRGEGIEFRFEAIDRMPNTLQSHRLIGFAGRFGVAGEMVDRLFRAYFTEGQDIGDTATLAVLGASIGLEPAAVEAFLAGEEERDRVIVEDERTRQLGVTGVPCYIVAGRYGVSGAQSPEVLLRILDLACQDMAVQAAE